MTMISLLNRKLKNKIALSAIALLPAGLFAQDAVAATTASPAESAVNPLWWLIIGIMITLLFAILVLSNVLLNLAKLTVEKGKAAKVVSLILMLLISSAGFSQEVAKAPAAAASPLGDWNFVMAAVVLLAEISVVLVLIFRIQSMLTGLSDKKEEKKALSIELPKIFDNLNASVSVEKESDILLDHNYDGIQELDNALPPWWKYGFYLTIIWAIGYYAYYTIGGGPSSHDEYIASVEQGKVEVAEFMKKNALNVDENTVTMGDATAIAEGKKLFAENCVACHGTNAEGNAVGPNLADDYWIHGGSLQDVFKSIKYGWVAKGMRSWKEAFSPVQIQQLTSYVKSVKGSNPANAKAPQGELYQEGAVTAAVDSVAAVTADSTATVAK